MNRSSTQFWVALVGIIGLVTITAIAVAGVVFADAPNELAFTLAGGLLAATSAAAAWLFRLNGNGK